MIEKADRLKEPAQKGRAREALALAPVALTALLAPVGAAEARDHGLPKGGATVLGAEEALAQGRAQLSSGRLIEALQAYNQALAQAPESIEALNGVAVCYDRMGKFETSRTFYEMALGIDPQSALLLNNYGYSLYLQGERAEATRFLALALATGDAEVQATALRVLARIEADGRNALPRPDAASPLVQQATATTPEAGPGPARIVRTSAHELRLVLGDAPPKVASRPPPAARPAVRPMPIAPAILAEALGPSTAAILPVAAFSEDEDRQIAQAEAAAIRRDAIAAAIHAQRQAQALSASQTAAVPGMMQAMIDLALGARPVAATAMEAADYFAPNRPAFPDAADPEWGRHQLLVVSAAPSGGSRSAARATAPHTLVVAAVLPSRQTQRAAELKPLPAAEPITRKRAFEQPFVSDDARLNGFADRMQGHEPPMPVDEQVAALEALMARAGRA